ncbi:DUF2865 domain-containing protein [Sinorhizobium alkalisoli]|uniref:Uncharacterized protein n=1 Tax=Sinorhizobium alkalisoli TaxID=1752398 RepID=A0A1E3VCP4_9HYPH|nr:DUF2865 domain-containing protein [Sinorhizobium alkalisoli]MCA1493552.1 DUF2865 domain-containing protein [Ensifer sp. NBAIM29]MCG5478769.1 DUF2865 domain-containing protein [Sinorhizobium alkalisoli]ODR91349.1 hypothetical protein A8M32_11185 [Sinorhizobium alkalisoli]QFI66556.1 hypothetical protein EKH55_1682 [Sinorhizobium alkalisoli]
MSGSPSNAPRGIAWLAAALLPLALATANEASASSVCERLQARLAGMPTTFSSNANLSDFTGAISRQNIELRRARNELRRLGCSRGSIIVIDDNTPFCAELDDTIARMEANLQELKVHRQQLVSNGRADARRRILAAMEINGCIPVRGDEGGELDEFATTTEADIHRNILRDLAPDDEDYPLLFEEPGIQDFSPMEGYGNGRLRTMCVRTCDGAFFPISSNASPADFPRDAELCRARCPQTETELYFHVLATEESDQMVSASTGRPYRELPTAFAYRTRDVASRGACGCKPAKAAGRTNRESTSEASLAASPSVVTIGGAKVGRTTEGAAARPTKERPYDPKSAKVRIVGPTFLPPEESAIDLKNPLGPSFQPQQEN